MQAPNTSKGFLYPSVKVQRCPSYHPCLVTSKCQSYNKHCVLCQFCESRVDLKFLDGSKNPVLGGLPAEATHKEDIQESLAEVQRNQNKRFKDIDADTEIINGRAIANKFNNYREKLDLIEKYSDMKVVVEDE